MGDIIQFPNNGKRNHISKIIDEGGLEDSIIMGYDKEGDIYIASTIFDTGELLKLIAICEEVLTSGEWET